MPSPVGRAGWIGPGIRTCCVIPQRLKRPGYPAAVALVTRADCPDTGALASPWP